MDDSLLFIESPAITIGTNTFFCRIPIRYKDTAMLEIIKKSTTQKTESFTTEIPVFYSDGTKLAVVKGRQIYRTPDGEKVGVELRHLPDGTVCEIKRKPAFEIRRKGAAALKMSAELHTFDGAFLRWSEEELSSLLSIAGESLKLACPTFTHCHFQGEVGIQIGTPTMHLPTCVAMSFVK
ncbi:MAG: hypothetical protein KKE86_05285 [Planctomycetes bacterium]|nr:hypothetical protein [Planctomycetota bacterium]MBU4398733.1 hypothetical protein [Planctomycetota bacterium]MCG2684769.1 hypothetical protein [Planctomycetales bacterium]